MRRNGIDIIIPVYNALDMLKSCVESIKKYTDLTSDHVIMIDDCSPDENVYPWMRQQETSGITVLRNEVNQGFSGTINRGMKVSSRDVILLNSDTVVTEGWVDKLVQCAYSSEDIATVTPFSNAATICSVPVYCQDNKLPEDYTVDEYAKLVELTSARVYPQISVAVGFCMYIKRSIIEEIGFFDAETFKKGYGEENDFCWRASELGYTHRLCDDTFIYHKGTASFVNADKENLMKEHARIVEERYPVLYRENDLFVSEDRNAPLRKAINLFSALKNQRYNILYILHNDYHSKSHAILGGTELHVNDLENGLCKKYNVFVAARSGTDLILSVHIDDKVYQVKYDIGKQNSYYKFHDNKIREAFADILTTFGIDFVHIHHLEKLSADIYDLCAQNHITIITSLHDFFTVCPTIKLLNNNNETCYGKETAEMCKECLAKKSVVSNIPNYLEIWRNKWKKLLSLSEKIIVPSTSTKEIISYYYPELKDRLIAIEHGIDTDEYEVERIIKRVNKYNKKLEIISKKDNHVVIRLYVTDINKAHSEWYLMLRDEEEKYLIPVDIESRSTDHVSMLATLPSAFLSGSPVKQLEVHEINGCDTIVDELQLELSGKGKNIHEKLNIACLGGITEEKGSSLISEAILHTDQTVNWFVCGLSNDSRLNNQTSENFYITGAYKRHQLERLLKQYQIDVICLPSICLETFSYTLSEAWLFGIPVIVLDLGALSDRMRQNEGGWILPSDTQGTELAKFVNDLAQHPEELAKKKESTRNIHVKTKKDMVEEYQGLYQKLISTKKGADKSRWSSVTKMLYEQDKLKQDNDKMELIQNLSRILNAREEELRIIKATKGYRLLEKARHIYLHLKGIE